MPQERSRPRITLLPREARVCGPRCRCISPRLALWRRSPASRHRRSRYSPKQNVDQLRLSGWIWQRWFDRGRKRRERATRSCQPGQSSKLLKAKVAVGQESCIHRAPTRWRTDATWCEYMGCLFLPRANQSWSHWHYPDDNLRREAQFVNQRLGKS